MSTPRRRNNERMVVRNHRRKPDPDAPLMDGADAPIRSLREDRLGRRSFAEALAAEVMAAPVARGYVMGLTGAWGTGKTSILNMAVDALGDKAIVVQFNPWMFSGTEALVSSFFAEVSKQLGNRDATFKTIAGKLADYGRVLSPLATIVGAGAAVTGAANILEKLAAAPSVFEQHHELRTLLEQLDKRLVVIVDDVDRLRPNEVLDMVRLVRLVGDFPNTLYLLAFDRGRIEECLGEGNPERGRAYLEKIVQVTHDVPIPRQPDVAALLVTGLQQLPDDVPIGPLDVGDWQNIFAFVIRPLLVTPRHVQRLLGSLSMTMRLVGDEVAFADLVGIEAIRVLHPALFSALVSVADHLSARARDADQSRDPRQRSAADSPIAPMHQVAPGFAEAVCRWLFPAARRYFENSGNGPEWEVTWRQQRKVASAAVLRFYLERQLPDGVVPARLVDEAMSLLSKRDELQQLLADLSPDEVMDLIERLHLAIDEIPIDPDSIEEDPARIALPVLLDLLPRLTEDRGLFGFSGSMILMRAAVRLLQRVPAAMRADTVRAVFDNTQTLSARLILVRVIGHGKNSAGLVDASVAEELEDQLRADLIVQPATDFVSETRLLGLGELMTQTSEGRAALHALAEDDQVMLSLLVSSASEIRGQEWGAAAVEVTPVLRWDELVGLLGDEMLVRRIAELLEAVQDDGMQVTAEQEASLKLAADYATGNRPRTSLEQLVQRHAASYTDSATETVAEDQRDRDDDQIEEPGTGNSQSGPDAG
jgi:hypothetical protein